MSRDRTRKMHRLAALNAFREQQAQQLFATAASEANQHARVQEACEAASVRHKARVAHLLDAPSVDVGLYLLSNERRHASDQLAAAAGARRQEAAGVMEETRHAWNLRRVLAEATADRATRMEDDDEREVLGRAAADLVEAWIARRQS